MAMDAVETKELSLPELLEASISQADSRIRNVSVHIDDQTVRLRGKVPSFFLRSLAIEAVSRVAGGWLIDDQLQVTEAT